MDMVYGTFILMLAVLFFLVYCILRLWVADRRIRKFIRMLDDYFRDNPDISRVLSESEKEQIFENIDREEENGGD